MPNKTSSTELVTRATEVLASNGIEVLEDETDKEGTRIRVDPMDVPIAERALHQNGFTVQASTGQDEGWLTIAMAEAPPEAVETPPDEVVTRPTTRLRPDPTIPPTPLTTTT
jgi:hypothetical protein